MTVGLGTGKAATRAIHALAAKADAGGFRGSCIATSEASARLATRLGLHVAAMQTVERVDYLFDGADEVDPKLRMIKGLGGAMTREKIVARAAASRVYLVQRRKLVDELGVRARVPIEVLQFGLSYVRRALGELGVDTIVRADESGVVLTDQNHAILDGQLPRSANLEEIAASIDRVAGVIGHGLFLEEADEVLVEETETGSVSRLERAV